MPHPSTSSAYGIWSLNEVRDAERGDNWPSLPPPPSIADLFSTSLYTGNGSTQTITNGIDLAGEGGMVWGKSRSVAGNHRLHDSERGTDNTLSSNSTDAEVTGNGIPSFNSDGFTMDSGTNINQAFDYVSWTFRKAPKFFDVVTYTGDGTAGNTVSHNLGSEPGVMIVKRTDATAGWSVYHTEMGNTKSIRLDDNGSPSTSSTYWNDTSPTSTEFTLGTNSEVNTSGGEYVAYLFANNNGDGGFGANADQDAIKCGTYAGTGLSGLDVSVGFEPQWVLIKNITDGGHSAIFDVERDVWLAADLTNTESGFWTYTPPPIVPTATGMTINDTNVTVNNAGKTYVYIAIRAESA